MNKTISITVVVLILVLGGFYFTNMNKDQSSVSTENNFNDVMVKDETSASDTAMMEKEKMEKEAMMQKDAMQKDKVMEKVPELADDSAMAPVGSYQTYSAEKVIEKSKTSRVVLFFNASWCPTCRALDNSIKVSLKQIPGDITILSVDYDTYKDLKKKYGVTYQHTMVQVDQEGNLVKKWSGSPTLASLVQEVK